MRPGPKTFAPSEEQRKLVTGLALVSASPQVGDLPLKSIELEVESSLQTHFREELELGRIQANVKVVANLYKMATGPTNVEVQDGLARRAARREHGQGRGSDPGIRCDRAPGMSSRPAGHQGRGDARVSQPPMTDLDSSPGATGTRTRIAGDFRLMKAILSRMRRNEEFGLSWRG